MEDYLKIYTDGSSAPNPRKGGVGFRMIFSDGTTRDFSPYGYVGATNNEMELQACILSLREVLKLEDLNKTLGVVIYTDSQYIVEYYKTAMFQWPKQKWMRSNGEPVLNAQQWKELVRLIKKISVKFYKYVTFEKVEAHAGIANNEAVDKLAKKSRKGPSGTIRISVNNVRRSGMSKKTVVGSIRGEGQRIRIRVVSGGPLKVQRIYRLRCVVLSKKSKYYGNMDFILSDEPLRPGHVYDVVLRSGLDYCKIEKIIKEIKKIINII